MPLGTRTVTTTSPPSNWMLTISGLAGESGFSGAAVTGVMPTSSASIAINAGIPARVFLEKRESFIANAPEKRLRTGSDRRKIDTRPAKASRVET